MLDEVRDQLNEESERLLHELQVVLPATIEHALSLGDLRENAEYHAALERQGFVRARLDYIARRLSELSDIDIDAIPDDRVGFGSTVTVRDIEDGEVEEYTLTLGEQLDFDGSEISMASPIGQALLGRQLGEEVSVTLPRSVIRYEIVKLVTIHESSTADSEN